MKSFIILICGLFWVFNVQAQTFTTSSNTFINGNFTDYDFADIDQDGDLDFISITMESTGTIVLYINDGNGNFTQDTNNSFPNLILADAAFGDVDGDSDVDLILIGDSNNNDSEAFLYLNNGSGIFTNSMTTTFEGAINGDVDVADVDNDNDLDILISGFFAFADFRTRLYLNNGSGNFTMQTPFVFDNTQGSENKFADFNNDGFVDVFMTGRNNSNAIISKIFSNNGDGTFTEVAGTSFEGVENGDVDVSDIDNDGDLDIVLTGGILEFTLHTKLYQNNGSFNFTEITNTGLEQLNFSDVKFADVDNDNDDDLFLSGIDNMSVRRTFLYTNDGNGNFSVVNTTPFTGINLGDIQTADVDGDNDIDVLIGGLKDPNSVDAYSNLLFINQTNTLSTTDFEAVKEIVVINNLQEKTISIQTEKIIKKVIVYALNGTMVQQHSNQYKIDTNTLYTGIYLLQIHTQNTIMNKKVIIL